MSHEIEVDIVTNEEGAQVEEDEVVDDVDEVIHATDAEMDYAAGTSVGEPIHEESDIDLLPELITTTPEHSEVVGIRNPTRGIKPPI